MRAHYLAILGLTEGATEVEIKKRYRKLVKKYHPDVNKETSSADKFIEIDNAYEYLTRKDYPNDVEQFSKDSYDVEVQERRERIRKSREKAWKKKQEKLRQQKNLLRDFSYFIILAALVNLTFLIDMFLPNDTIDEQIQAIEYTFGQESIGFDRSFEIIGSTNDGYHKIIMMDHSIIIDDQSPIPKTRNVRLELSSIYKVSSSISYDSQTIPVLYSLYRIFNVVIYIVIIAGGLFFYLEPYYDFRFSIVALIIVMVFMQVIILLS